MTKIMRPLRSILITGGAGFIGSEFVRQMLRSSGAVVVTLDKLTYAGNLAALADCEDNPRYQFVQGDIADADLVGHLLTTHECDCVVNFAAESHVDRSISDPLGFTRTNVLGTCQLLDAALAYWQSLPATQADEFRFLQISTDEVYGSADADECFSEASSCRPNSPYAASKAAADHFARAYHQTYRLPTMIARSSNNYGPFQQPEKLIPLMVLNAFEDRPLPVYGDGSNIRDWLHVSDHCRGLRRIVEAGRIGDVYNLAGGCEFSNLEIVRQICAAVDEQTDRPLPCHELISFVTDRPGHDFRYAIDSAKIREQLGWQPEVEFNQGVHETVAWYAERFENQDSFLNRELHRTRQGLGRRATDSASDP